MHAAKKIRMATGMPVGTPVPVRKDFRRERRTENLENSPVVKNIGTLLMGSRTF